MPQPIISGPSLGMKGTPGATLPEVEIKGKLPSWAKYENNLDKLYSKLDMIGGYLTPMARSLGNSETNYPQRIDKEYDKIKNNFIARSLIINRTDDKYTNKERDIINNSDFKGKDKKYAYENPVKLPIGSGDAAQDFIYDNSFLTTAPISRKILQKVALGQVGGNDKSTQTFLKDNNELTPSPYAPKNDYFKFMPSYTLKDTHGVTENASDFLKQYADKKTIDSIKKTPIFIKDSGGFGGGSEALYKEDPDLAKYKKGIAWDKEKKLPYYFISDAWDFDPSSYSDDWKEKDKKSMRSTYQQSYLLNKVGNPYKVYDRFYFEPETGKYIDDSKDSRFNQNAMPFMDPSASVNKSATHTLPKFNPEENKKVIDWTNQYVNSNKYKERLAPFYKYPDYIQKQRAGLTGDLTVRNNSGTGSAYYPNGNEIALSPLQSMATGSPLDEILAHEAAHAVNGNNRVRGAQLSPQEMDFILRRNKKVGAEGVNRYAQQAKETGKPIQDFLQGPLHDLNPSESHSDISSLRYLMKKRGIYDASKGDITPEILKQAAKDPAINRSFIWKRLKESFEDKGLMEIMNKVAKNNNINKQNMA